jgi:hypothetical protein
MSVGQTDFDQKAWHHIHTDVEHSINLVQSQIQTTVRKTILTFSSLLKF